MVEKLKNLGWKQFGGLVLIVIIIIAFGFGGFGGGFSTNNQNNIAKINKTNVTTQDFMDYVNQSGISQEAIRNNLENNIIEELLSGLISTTLIDLEIEDFKLSINEKTILKYLKDNKNFKGENGAFERIKYEKFLLSNNMSAPLFELKLKNQGLQKHLFDFIGAGTVMPEFLIESKFEENNKSLAIEYFDMENLYKIKEDYTSDEINTFLEENKDQLNREYIDFKYVVLNPKNLIGIDELYDIKKLFSATALVRVRKNSFFVQGHFPENPVMPGVLIVESFGQAAAALTAHGLDKSTYENKLVFLMGVEKARFRNPVIPDCDLLLKIEAIRSHGRVWKYKGEAFVDEVKMADAIWSATIVDKK